MDQSPEVKDLANALCTFQSKMQTVAKDAKNPFFKSKYATLESIWEAARPFLTECGLAVVQGGTAIFPTAGQAQPYLTTTILHSPSGQWIRGDFILSPAKLDAQGFGSAITYMRRYSFCSMLGIQTGEDDDGNAASTKA